MKQLLAIALFAFATLFAGNALASDVKDIGFYDKYCCCKAGCPEGSYFCRSMCTVLGGSCSQSASDFPEGADPTIRNSCTGAKWVWNWFSSGIQCPAACPANSGS